LRTPLAKAHGGGGAVQPRLPEPMEERMSRLSDTQVMVLARAAQRNDGGVILPENLRGAAAVKLVRAPLERGLAREVAAKKNMPVWRRDEAGADYALKITRAGRQAVDLAQAGVDQPVPKPTPKERPRPGRHSRNAADAAKGVAAVEEPHAA